MYRVLTVDRHSGPALTLDEIGRKQEIQVSGRIIIDPKSFDQFSLCCSGRWKPMSSRDYDMLVVSRATQTAMRKVGLDVEGGPVMILSYFHHLICSSTVRGYSIKLKMWLHFYVGNLVDTGPNSSAIEKVIPSQNMENIISKFDRARPEIKGGLWIPSQIQGIEMSVHILGLESALDGVTAEAVSDRIGIPLLTISADDLGTSLLQTELRVNEVLELVHRWHTLLLLEGFDILVEKYSGYDFRLDDVLRIIINNLCHHDYKGPCFISTERADDVHNAILKVYS